MRPGVDSRDIPAHWGSRPPAPSVPHPIRRLPSRILETSVPSVFAAGDVRHGWIKRVAGAVGEGAMAALQHRLEEIVASG